MAEIKAKEIIDHLNLLGEDNRAKNDYLKTFGILPNDIINAIREGYNESEIQLFTYLLKSKNKKNERTYIRRKN